jgi:hypothetical protein
MNFNSYAWNKYSENGEDGIIKEILTRLRPVSELDGWCVEFGAWDGVYASNTCRLIREEGYSAILIEGDSSRVKKLIKNHSLEKVIVIERFVKLSGENSLDRLLQNHPLPLEFDLLSIDVDGIDFYIFESLERYHPKIVCIEYNQTIPNSVEFVQSRDYRVCHGSSLRSLAMLGTEKGYQVVCITETNIIFLREDLALLLGLAQRSLAELRPSGEQAITVFQGYDGSLLYSQNSMLLVWHGVPVELAKVQFLPQFLRRFVKSYNFFQWFMFCMYIFLKFPGRSIQFVRNHGWGRIFRR